MRRVENYDGKIKFILTLEKINMVLLDVMMPKVDGFELIKELRKRIDDIIQSDFGQNIIINKNITIPSNEDKNNSQNNSTKLPATGKESILGYISVAAIAVGAVLYKKKK